MKSRKTSIIKFALILSIDIIINIYGSYAQSGDYDVISSDGSLNLDCSSYNCIDIYNPEHTYYFGNERSSIPIKSSKTFPTGGLFDCPDYMKFTVDDPGNITYFIRKAKLAYVGPPAFLELGLTGNTGKFSVTLHYEKKKRDLFDGCTQESYTQEGKINFCRIKPHNTPYGLVQVGNNTPGSNISLLADPAGEVVVDLAWFGNESNYCHETMNADVGGKVLVIRGADSDAGTSIVKVNDGSSSSSFGYESGTGSGNLRYYSTVKLRGIGRHVVSMKIIDQFNNEHFTSPITITVLPGCYGSPLPNVTLSGPDIKVVHNGYGDPIGSYRLKQNEEYTLSWGSVTNFCTYYQVSLGNGVTVVQPSLGGPCMPSKHTGTPLISGIEVTEVYPGSGFKFIIRDQIGGYKIDIQKRPNLSAMESIPDLGVLCPDFQPIVLTVGGENENLTSNCLIIIAPSTIPTLFPGVSSYTTINSILQYFDYTVQSAQGVWVRSEGGDGVNLKDGANLHIIEPYGTSEIPLAEQVDTTRNWIQSRAYDDEGRIITEAKQFFDNRGRPTQSQAKNLSGGVVMASQTIYDKYGRPAITTLPAPIRASEQTQAVEECGNNIQLGQDLYFIYKNDFITKSNLPYSYMNFDNVGFISKMNNPDGLDNTQPGTLGWYYGPNNVSNAIVDQTKNQQRFIEPYVAQTNYPYTRNVYLEDGTNEAFSSTLPGDQHKMGMSKQESSVTLALTPSDTVLLADYLTIRGLHVFPNLTTNPASLVNKAFRVSAKDIEQDEVVSIQDEEGHILIIHHIASGKKSFMFYDLYGRKVCSISPNGVEKLLLDKTNNTLYQNIDKTVYRYNYKGQLIETTEKDFGTTRFMYRLDGMLRYSQNEKQRLSNSFGFILYDYAGRPIESGLFTPFTGSTLLFNSSDLKLTLEENSTNSDLSMGGTKSEVVYTVYDLADEIAISSGDITEQTFLKGNVSYNYRYEIGGALIKTWFSYDERGRILWTAQRIPGLGAGSATYGVKKTSYTYAPNGNVKEVAYTGTMANDNFYHVYYYDLDNRLSHVYTTTSTPTYTTSGELINGKLQAHYTYYLHGSLKRVELAENLQGLDYAYTPQGWLKSFNYPNISQDPGKDGATSSNFPEDVFAMRMDYFDNDYSKAGTNIISEKYYKAPQLPFKQYYNGNITGVTWMKKNQAGTKIPAAYGYEYDENYQLSNASYLSAQLGTGGFLGPNFTIGKFQERNIAYDANGNIQTLLRTKADATTLHNFQYQYKTNTNQLEQVNNLLNNGVYSSYTYDAIGQLSSVVKDGNTTYVHFDNRGMLTAITANSDGTNPIVRFFYDDKGMRYKKESYNTLYQLQFVTYYVHDEAKQTIAIYDNNNSNATLAITEIPIYGSDRIGMLSEPGSSQQYQYELKDHLGNVRSVIYPVYTTPAPLIFNSGFEGTDYTAYGNDYNLLAKKYPDDFNIPAGYGLKMLALQFPNKSTGTAYRRALRAGDRLASASIRAYVPASGTRAGRLVSGFFNANGEQLYYDADRLYPAKDSSAQTGSASQWTTLTVGILKVSSNLYDTRGNIVSQDDIFLHVYVNQMAESGNTEIFYDQLQVNITYAPLVDKSELQGLIAYTDYYPYGLPLSDKYVVGQGYRFGYQGQYAEADQETGFNSFELRMYDPAIGRWLSVDPKREFASGYLGMGNNPITFTDPDGGGTTDWYKNEKTGKYEWHDKNPGNGYTWSGNIDFAPRLDLIERSTLPSNFKFKATEVEKGLLIDSDVEREFTHIGHGLTVSNETTVVFGVPELPGVGGGAKLFSSGFKSFSAMKRYLGSAGSGRAWHHIVEQTPGNVKKFGNTMIQNTKNIINVAHGKGSIHAKISGYYSSKQLFTKGKTVREWISEKSFKEQYDFGVDILYKVYNNLPLPK